VSVPTPPGAATTTSVTTLPTTVMGVSNMCFSIHFGVAGVLVGLCVH